MPRQEVVILSGVDGTEPSRAATDNIRKLIKALRNIQVLWERGWDYKANAVQIATHAIRQGDRALYDKARGMFDEGSRWQRRAGEHGAENDELRAKLYGELTGKGVSLTDEQRNALMQPSGFQVPAKYLRSAGGTPLARFPEWS